MKGLQWEKATRYVNDPGDHFPSCFSQVLAEGVPIEPNKTRFLDIGSGSGIIGIYCLIEKKAKFVTFNDISSEFLSLTKRNVNFKIDQHEIDGAKVDYIESEYSNIPYDVIAKHDLLGFNPPQLPDKYLGSTENNDTTQFYRSGGPDGLSHVRAFVQWYAGLPVSAPDAVISISSFLGISNVHNALQNDSLEHKKIHEDRVQLRPFMIADADVFSMNKTDKLDRELEKNSNGDWTKSLMVFRIKHRK